MVSYMEIGKRLETFAAQNNEALRYLSMHRELEKRQYVVVPSLDVTRRRRSYCNQIRRNIRLIIDKLQRNNLKTKIHAVRNSCKRYRRAGSSRFYTYI